jgi:hypothetical protein
MTYVAMGISMVIRKMATKLLNAMELVPKG